MTTFRPEDGFQEVEDIVGADNVSVRSESCLTYSSDVSSLPSLAEQIIRKKFEVIAKPVTVESLQQLVRFSRDNKIPIVPRGSGTSGWGGAIPTRGGLCINLGQMANILHLDDYGQTVTVEAGITWRELLMVLEKMGSTLPVYPSSATSATVGGYVASGGIGIGSAKNGDIRSQIVGLEVVMANGMLASVGNLIQNPSENNDPSQYNEGNQWLHDNFEGNELCDVFIATYGTLGIITKVTIRMIPKLQLRPFVCTFDDMTSLAKAATDILKQAAPYNLRFVADNYTSKLDSLIGNEAERNKFILTGALLDTIFQNDDSLEAIAEITKENNGTVLEDNRADYYWEERLFPLRIKRHGPSLIPSEVFIPLERLNEFYDHITNMLESSSVAIEGTVSVDGQTSFLAWILDDERKKYSYLAGWYRPFQISAISTRFGGKPYAVGLWNSMLATEFYGKELYHQLENLKQAVDPDDLMNPMKVFGGRVEAGKKSQIFGFTIGSLGVIAMAIFGPPLLGLTWLSDFLMSPMTSQIPVPVVGVAAIIGGIAGWSFIKFMTLNMAFTLVMPFLKLMGRIWNK